MSTDEPGSSLEYERDAKAYHSAYETKYKIFYTTKKWNSFFLLSSVWSHIPRRCGKNVAYRNQTALAIWTMTITITQTKSVLAITRINCTQNSITPFQVHCLHLIYSGISVFFFSARSFRRQFTFVHSFAKPFSFWLFFSLPFRAFSSVLLRQSVVQIPLRSCSASLCVALSGSNRSASKEVKEMEVNDCILFVQENNSYKDFIAIVGDESIGSRANAYIVDSKHSASLCTLSVKIRKRVNLFARQFGDGTKSFVAHAMQSCKVKNHSSYELLNIFPSHTVASVLRV